MISDKKKARFEELCRIMKELSGIDPRENSRKHDVVTTRMMVAYQLMREGFTSLAVGELFGRDHSTVLNYKERWLALFMPGWEAERELWERFKAAAGEDMPKEV